LATPRLSQTAARSWNPDLGGQPIAVLNVATSLAQSLGYDGIGSTPTEEVAALLRWARIAIRMTNVEAEEVDTVARHYARDAGPRDLGTPFVDAIVDAYLDHAERDRRSDPV